MRFPSAQHSPSVPGISDPVVVTGSQPSSGGQQYCSPAAATSEMPVGREAEGGPVSIVVLTGVVSGEW